MELFDKHSTTNEQGDNTVLNTEMEKEKTSLNTETDADFSETNQETDLYKTVVNPQSNKTSGLIGKGTKICGDYVITGTLDVNAGEADLFTCGKDGKTYIAKVYRRQAAIKESVVEKLLSLRSPYVVRTYATGTVGGYPVEIIEYYKNGSLYGKIFDNKTLKETIIPCLNEGLHLLHQNGIIHKDLKPSNIMLSDDKKSVVILDFGISSMREEGNTVIVTRTGLTPEFTAPETFRNLFLNESDYYSLGVTLYALYTGHTPYDGLNKEELEKVSALQKIPFPEDMDGELKSLIQGLTYQDITNRKDKNNPDRRWGYEEVKNWLSGIEQPIPGASHVKETSFRPIEFDGQNYMTMESLIDAMNENWEEGKKYLFRGTMARNFSRIDPDVSDIIWDAQDRLSDNVDQDMLFFETLYKILPDNKELRWKGKKYKDLQTFGTIWIRELRKGSKAADSYADELMNKGVLSAYLEAVEPETADKIKVLKAAETKWKTFNGNEEEKAMDNWNLAYLLSGDQTLQIDGNIFISADDIADYVIDLLKRSRDDMETFGEKLIHQDGMLDPQFEAWIHVIGKEKELENWRKAQQ